jgi:uncharacterized RDD family membrane protein YckC
MIVGDRRGMTGYEDTRTIATPEGVELELPLAGLGSRLIGLIVDTLIQGTVLIAALVAAALVHSSVLAIGISGFALLLVVAYDVVFEVRGGGRTPGKRAAGLRVVMDGGAPVGLRASLIRNAIRLLEGFATAYVPAMVSVLVTRDNQRLGDLAAGTLVIRDPKRPPPPAPAAPAPPPDDAIASWDVTGVHDDELALVRAFLARREQLAPHARRTLARQLASTLRPRVAGVRPGITDEAFLERLAAAKGRER